MITQNLLHSGVGIEIVECLWQETGDIDGISGGELHVLIQFGIHEGILHKCLTVVEDTIHLDSRDVLAEGRELALLDRADFSFGIEHINVDTVYTEESVGYGRTCIARGSHKDIDLALSVFLTDEILQEAGHETGTHILKGEGRTVEKFQRVDVILDFHDRTVEGERVVDNLLQGIRLDILAEESIGDSIGNLLEGHLVDVVEEILRQLFDLLWHIETAVFCQSLDDGFMKVGNGSISVGTVIFHIN